MCRRWREGGLSAWARLASMAWGRSLGTSPRSGAGRAPRAATRNRRRAQLFFCGRSGPETARTGSSGVYRVRVVVWGAAGARFHFSRIARKIFDAGPNRRGLHAPVALAVAALQRLRLPSSASGDETRSSETQDSCCAPGGGHWCSAFLWAAGCGPSRPEQGRKGLGKLSAAVWHPAPATSRSQIV